jgi:hypothetical protein
MSPIARKPKITASKTTKFLRGNGSAPPKLDRLPIMINFDRNFLDRIDRVAQEMGLNRTAFITNAVAEKLIVLEKAQ